MGECKHRVNGICSFCGRASGAIVQELQATIDELIRDIDALSRPHVARIVETTLAEFRQGAEFQLAAVTRKLATAVEALEWYAIARANSHRAGVALQALAAIRAQEEKKGYTVDDSPETMARVKERFGMSPPCTCPRGERIGMLGVDPNCPKHGAK
jgi:hypothetical protein